jgi:hypothetical protein
VHLGPQAPQTREVMLNQSHKPQDVGAESAPTNGNDDSGRCYELTEGSFHLRRLRRAKEAIMSERSGLVLALDLESRASVRRVSQEMRDSSRHVPEDMYLQVDTSLYTRQGAYKDLALEKMYLADASSQNISSERTQQTVIRLGVHVALFLPMLFTSFQRYNERGHTAVQGAMPNSHLEDKTYTNVFIAISAFIVLVADTLVVVNRKEMETLSTQMRLTQGSVWFQLPSVLLVYLSVGCEVLNARRIALTMFMVGVLEVQSPWVLSNRLPVRSLRCDPLPFAWRSAEP